MAQSNQSSPEATSLPQLSQRLTAYTAEIQQLVRQGAENPQYELTKEVYLSRDQLKSRLDFVKLVQGLANALPAVERCIVIGADQAGRSFVPVANTAELDSARVSQILSKYLEPVPAIEVFNSLMTDDGQPFVLVVVGSEQPRPIVAKADQQDSEGKLILRHGDVWVKRNTSLDLADRHHFEQIHLERLTKEVETLARSRFAHFRVELEAERNATNSKIPSASLLLGPKQELRAYCQQLIAEEDWARFRMLLELIRDQVVEGWSVLSAKPAYEVLNPFRSFYGEQFFPSLTALGELGLLLIKHEISADWFEPVASLLLEAFKACRPLLQYGGFQSAQIQPEPQLWEAPLSVFATGRCLATYAVHRQRYSYLPTLLKKYAPVMEANYDVQTPFMFWPIRVPGALEMPQGHSLYLWEKLIGPTWNGYFSTISQFLNSAYEFEFILELNSFLIEGGEISKKGHAWFVVNRPSTTFMYVPDFLKFSLERIMRIADEFYDAVALGPDAMFLYEITVEKILLDFLLKDVDVSKRLSVVAQFLQHLVRFQAEVVHSHGRFSPWFDWSPKLKPLMEAYKMQSKEHRG